MHLDEIEPHLRQLFGESLHSTTPGLWQVEHGGSQILILLSDDRSWLRVLLPISPFQDVRPLLEQLFAYNFDASQETRYALHQDVLWGVFQHPRASLTAADLTAAIDRLQMLKQQGLTDCFNQFVDNRIGQIIQAAKQQGQTLTATMQTLERFYDEGLLGDLTQSPEQRQTILGAWHTRLQQLWPDIIP
ncbi:hypothetical protein [Trichothermofontia sp.]